MTLKIDRYTPRVIWSEDDREYVVKGFDLPKVRRVGWLLVSIGFIVLEMLFGCSGSSPVTGSISGSVTVPGSQSGRIYVLAIPAENMTKLRVAETEALPHRSAWVSRYAQLSAPGSYTLDGLVPGNYVVWGWVDVNGDGGVNHSNYAEPVGWYQTRAALYLSPVPVEAGRNATAIDLRLLAPTPYPEQEKTITSGQGGGKLKTVKGQKVLQLWGTPEERAYSHGYLVGPQIMDFFNYVVVEYFAMSVDLYQEVLQYMQGHFAGNAPYASEAEHGGGYAWPGAYAGRPDRPKQRGHPEVLGTARQAILAPGCVQHKGRRRIGHSFLHQCGVLG
jgi:hypothetical protein